jgi:solute:Na+ symporter, SSS family
MDPLLYQYGVGGIVFFIGLIYAFKQGYIGTQGTALKNMLIVCGGFLFFLGMQSYLQYAPMNEQPAISFSGEAPNTQTGMLGTNLDYIVMFGYFLSMLFVGVWFGRGQSTTKDFFFGGQKFSWWLISFSLVASTIGSASFVKYSKIAYSYGIASSQTYLNDWFWIPLLLFGWLPILYFSKVLSIPEYFERRFDVTSRRIATYLLLAYLIGYVGINLFTMGQALSILLGWNVFWAAACVAGVSAIYVTFGGQTSVIMTDLFQGVMLLATGLLLLLLGINELGGFVDFWEHLPRGHRQAFPHFNKEASYPAVGIFWQDAMANSAMFYFLNQGMVMRLMAARSIDESRKAMITMLIVLMPIAALVVASGGWVGQAMVHAGLLPEMNPKEAFFITAEYLSMPGMFGLIMAALTAALMSTVDTLITAISAIVVNDIYKPIKPKAKEHELLKVARISSISIAILGVLLVPVFQQFKSIYAAHGAFTAAITPPLVVTLLLGVFWKKFSPPGAKLTMLLGSLIIFGSILFPEWIEPFAHGVPMKEVDTNDFLAGKNQFKFMRAFFGIIVCLSIGIISGFVFEHVKQKSLSGLVWGTVKDAIASYKGSEGEEGESEWALGQAIFREEQSKMTTDEQWLLVKISPKLASKLEAKKDDLLYLSDNRIWLGGLRASHAIVEEVDESLDGEQIIVGQQLFDALVKGREQEELRLKRLY